MVLASLDLEITAQPILRQPFQPVLQRPGILDLLGHLAVAHHQGQAAVGQVHLAVDGTLGEDPLRRKQVTVMPPQARADGHHVLEQLRPGEQGIHPEHAAKRMPDQAALVLVDLEARVDLGHQALFDEVEKLVLATLWRRVALGRLWWRQVEGAALEIQRRAAGIADGDDDDAIPAFLRPLGGMEGREVGVAVEQVDHRVAAGPRHVAFGQADHDPVIAPLCTFHQPLLGAIEGHRVGMGEGGDQQGQKPGHQAA